MRILTVIGGYITPTQPLPGSLEFHFGAVHHLFDLVERVCDLVGEQHSSVQGGRERRAPRDTGQRPLTIPISAELYKQEILMHNGRVATLILQIQPYEGVGNTVIVLRVVKMFILDMLSYHFLRSRPLYNQPCA